MLKVWVVERIKDRSYVSDDKAVVVAESEVEVYKFLDSGWKESDDLLPGNSTIREADLTVAGILLLQASDG